MKPKQPPRPEERVAQGEFASEARAQLGREDAVRSDAAFRSGPEHDRPLGRLGERRRGPDEERP